MTVYKKFYYLMNTRERKKFLLLCMMILIGSVLETMGIGLVVPMIVVMTKNNVVDRYPILSFLGHPTQIQLIIMCMLMFVGFYILKTIYLTRLFSMQSKFIFGMQKDLSCKLFAGYLHQPWAFHLNNNSSHLISNIVNETGYLCAGILQSSILVITESLILAIIFTLLVITQPTGVLLVISTIGVVVFVFHCITRNRLLVWGKARQYHETLRMHHVQQGLGGAKDVKILGREDEFIKQFSIHNEENIRAVRLERLFMDLPRLWLECLAMIGMAILVLTMIYQGKSPEVLLMTLGLFMAGTFRALPSITRILSGIQGIRYRLPVVDVLYKETQKIKWINVHKCTSLLPFNHYIQLEHVCYRYENSETLVLDCLNLRILRGSAVGFIGPSGAGKSTLVDIILGLITPISGYVKIDDVDIAEHMRGWQNQIGYVQQSIYLTDDTLRRNIAFGIDDAHIDEKAVTASIKDAQLVEFISSLPLGLETLVGERGVRLSGGQRQRIGIARALYHNPAVLVLDEATSALDTVTEQSVMEAVNALRGKKTLIIVAHRLSTVANCDYLYKMENGKIVAEGALESVTNNYIEEVI